MLSAKQRPRQQVRIPPFLPSILSAGMFADMDTDRGAIAMSIGWEAACMPVLDARSAAWLTSHPKS